MAETSSLERFLGKSVSHWLEFSATYSTWRLQRYSSIPATSAIIIESERWQDGGSEGCWHRLMGAPEATLAMVLCLRGRALLQEFLLINLTANYI
jgi:hypothetical protein